MDKLNTFLLNSERRLQVERRRFHYSIYIPERRSGFERRSSIRWFESATGNEMFLKWNSSTNCVG